ncbi:MAG: alanine--tRNA ligase [Thiohalobacteraceae bacterium]
MLTSAEIRQSFLDFFHEKGHAIVPSSSLVPGNDPTLLFTNAGMVQFKDVFLGLEQRPYVRAASSQRCVRAGGKHNDLENVGYTARHHTFFEMLGNFSFGDYFKREAIHYAWDFLTRTMNLPPERLWVTVYQDDDEAADIWLKEVGVDPARFTRIGDTPGGRQHESDNFWSMGDTGPCGPCTEIFYDHGPAVAGGPPGSPEADGDRYIEIWNLVFMQYNRDAAGKMSPLPKPSVDTGMGLERLAAVLQGVHSNYDIDLFVSLIRAAADLAGCKDTDHSSLRVIADHIRSCAFLITDGVLPGNEGRGYVLRRIVRRAVRHGYRLGINDTFFYKLIGPLCADMGAAYPELAAARPQIERVLRQEEERFAETLDQGMKILEADIAALQGREIPGATVFKLYDTYGFPVDLTADIARERELVLDMAGFEREMEAQRERARAASQFGVDYGSALKVEGCTDFTGYEHLIDQCRVTALYRDNLNPQPVQQLEAGEDGFVILDHTPFYAESGGQVGDQGVLEASNARFKVFDTQKQQGVHIHIGTLESGSLKLGDSIEAHVDAGLRRATMLNHSATHLLHAALRHVLGDHVQQKGSLVDPERLRFDFAHFEAVKPAELARIEGLVNEQIRLNHPVETRVMGMDDAIQAGALALFGEKYGTEVRVLSMGDFSVELCGGTHVGRAGDIGLFKIVSEGGVASGVRRIEAVTGQRALDYVAQTEKTLGGIAGLVKGSAQDVEQKVGQLVERSRRLEKELDQLKAKLASQQGTDLASQAIEVDGIQVLAARLDGIDSKALRDTVDQLKNKLGSAAILLATVDGDKVSLIAGVTKDQTGRIKAGDLVNCVAERVGGRGGGRPDMAQAGGNRPEHLDAALADVAGWVKSRLAATETA